MLAAASVLRDGPRSAVKGVIRTSLRTTERIAEAGEQLRDIYAEAQEEHQASTELAPEPNDDA